MSGHGNYQGRMVTPNGVTPLSLLDNGGNAQAPVGIDITKGVILGPDGREVRRRETSPIAFWLPLRDVAGLAGTNTPVDRAMGVALTQGGTVAAYGSSSPYLPFGGTNYLQVPITQPMAGLRRLFNLKNLLVGEAIYWFTVLTHGATQAGQSTLFFWGRSAVQGWGIAIKGTTMHPLLMYRSPGSAAVDAYVLEGGVKFTGSLGTNTKTAYAGCITRLPDASDLGSIGLGSGLFQIEQSYQCLGVPLALNNAQTAPFGVDSFPRLGMSTGTDVPSVQSDSLLTIGARPTSSYSANFIDQMTAGYGLDQIGFARRDYRAGLVCQISRELATDPTAFPKCLLP